MPFTSRWSTAIVALVVIGTVFTAGCTSNVQTTQAQSVTVGALLPLTGDAASVGANVNAPILPFFTNRPSKIGSRVPLALN
ncbi:MAG: hypothetical protein ABSB81_01990 [Halobacteriota archaeon]